MPFFSRFLPFLLLLPPFEFITIEGGDPCLFFHRLGVS